ncbi:hypothetical protein EPR50_G00185960 [Perca flavescens]|uniref:Uncharacterized protein n=1 Tax=Perca flavescens TaxID=8167 RepID=A0A484C8A3_PERFV|nr:hypothetical protein EPR50_G00185960 [Perca flavescens]
MTRKYLSCSHDKSLSNSLNAKESCFNASFLISLRIGNTGPSFTKGKEIMPSHNSLWQQHLSDTPFGRSRKQTHNMADKVRKLSCKLLYIACLNQNSKNAQGEVSKMHF